MSYTNKTQPTKVSPEMYIMDNLKGKKKVQKEALDLVNFYSKVTGSSCVMWNKIFGFGKYQYLDSKGGEHACLITGFAVSSSGFTLYNIMGWDTYTEEAKKLGTYKISGKSCLAMKSIKDIDLKVLKVITKQSIQDMKKKYKIKK